MMILFTLFLLLSATLLSGCLFFQPKSRLKATVLYIHSQLSVQEGLQEPKKSYVQAYFPFPEDFSSEIIFSIDQEFIEGVHTPIHFPGADWMALVGIIRDRILNISSGTSESLNGTPSDVSV